MKKNMMFMIFLIILTFTFNEEIKFSKLIKNNIVQKKRLNDIINRNENNHKIIIRKFLK